MRVHAQPSLRTSACVRARTRRGHRRLRVPRCVPADARVCVHRAACVCEITCALTCASLCIRQCASISPQPVAVLTPALVCTAPHAQGRAERGFSVTPKESLGSLRPRYPRQGAESASAIPPSSLSPSRLPSPGSIWEFEGRSHAKTRSGALQGALRGPWHVLRPPGPPEQLLLPRSWLPEEPVLAALGQELPNPSACSLPRFPNQF